MVLFRKILIPFLILKVALSIPTGKQTADSGTPASGFAVKMSQLQSPQAIPAPALKTKLRRKLGNKTTQPKIDSEHFKPKISISPLLRMETGSTPAIVDKMNEMKYDTLQEQQPRSNDVVHHGQENMSWRRIGNPLGSDGAASIVRENRTMAMAAYVERDKGMGLGQKRFNISTKTSKRKENKSHDDIAGLIIVQMDQDNVKQASLSFPPETEQGHGKATSTEIPIKVQDNFKNYDLVHSTNFRPKLNYGHQGGMENIKTGNIDTIINHGGYITHGHEELGGYRTILDDARNNHHGHNEYQYAYATPTEHHDFEFEHPTHKEEMELLEGKITIAKTLLGSKYMKKGAVFVIGLAMLVTLILGGVSAAGASLSPLIFPLALLPIAIVAFILFIPSIILFVPIVVSGLSGGKRRMTTTGNIEENELRTILGMNVMGDYFGGLDEIQNELDSVLKRISH